MSESESKSPYEGMENLPREELLSFLFVQMIMQTAEMALMFLGQRPHPETGKPVIELNAARMFIDQLEALEAKTKGNLSPEEDMMLKQSLMQARMAFVQAVENPQRHQSKDLPPEPSPAAPPPSGESTKSPTAEEEPRKRFSKKF